MSYSKKPTTYSKKTTAFCKVCKDLGKPESLYTSHFVRQSAHPNSMIVCPTLLANVCKYCHLTGHFAGSCPKAKREAQAHREERIRATRKPEEKKVSKPKNQNIFDVLHSDSEDEAPEKKPEEKKREKKRIVNWSCVDSDSEEED